MDPRYRGSMEEAEALDDVKHQLVQELLDLKEPEKVEKVPVVRAAAQLLLEETRMNFLLLHPPRRRGLSDLLQNRRARQIAGQAQAAVPKRVQADASSSKKMHLMHLGIP